MQEWERRKKSSHDIVNRPLPIYIASTYVCISIHKSSVGKFLTNAWLSMLVDVALCLCCDTRMYSQTISFPSSSSFVLFALLLVLVYLFIEFNEVLLHVKQFFSLERILWFLFFVSYCFACFGVSFAGWEIRMRMVKGEALRC
jgi:hypothetical protein